MATSVSAKFRIKEGMKLLAINSPRDFAVGLGKLPAGVSIHANSKNAYHQVHWFVKNRAEMEKDLSRMLSLLKEDVVVWIYYPKGSSSLQTDLTRDKGWEKLLVHDHLQWVSLISFDETWSAFGMRLKTEKETKKPVVAKERVIFQYADPVNKTIRLPEDMKKAMDKSKKAREFFEGLSFTNKKEYVEWVVTAKREETRAERIAATMERLLKSCKNPRRIKKKKKKKVAI